MTQWCCHADGCLAVLDRPVSRIEGACELMRAMVITFRWSESGATPMPLRDEFGLNDARVMHENVRQAKAQLENERRELRASLSKLPQPQNEYQVCLIKSVTLKDLAIGP